MKQIFVFAALAACLVSCSKDWVPEPGIYWGKVSAKQGGADWGNSYIYGAKNRPNGIGLTIKMNRFSKEGFLRESMWIYKIPDSIGHYRLSRTSPWAIDTLTGAGFAFFIDDGDVPDGPTYQLMETGHENYLEITRKKGDEVWGRFQIAFVIDSPPDTIIFTEGSFHTKIIH
jgi:hypothetical protein